MGAYLPEGCAFERAGIEIESACSSANRGHRTIHEQFPDIAEVHETYARGSGGDYCALSPPAFHHCLVVKHHVILAVGGDWARIDYLVDYRIGYDEHLSGDDVWGARSNAAIDDYAARFQPVDT